MYVPGRYACRGPGAAMEAVTPTAAGATLQSTVTGIVRDPCLVGLNSILCSVVADGPEPSIYVLICIGYACRIAVLQAAPASTSSPIFSSACLQASTGSAEHEAISGSGQGCVATHAGWGYSGLWGACQAQMPVPCCCVRIAESAVASLAADPQKSSGFARTSRFRDGPDPGSKIPWGHAVLASCWTMGITRICILPRCQPCP